MIKPQTAPIALKTALGIAVALHVLLIVGLSFSAPTGTRKASVDVTFSTIRSSYAPTDAKHIAQDNQLGSGTVEEALTPSTTETAKFTSNVAEPVLKTKQASKQEHSAVAVVDTTASSDTQLNANNSKKQDEATTGLNELNRQLQAIKALEAKVSRTHQAYAQRPRIHRLTSVAAKAASDADYQRKWQEKIELVGNANYPRSAIENSIDGDVRLSVLINPNGAVKKIRLLKSSGNDILDQFAIASVKLSAPFAPFPEALASKADLLEIIRTWQFRNNSLATSG